MRRFGLIFGMSIRWTIPVLALLILALSFTVTAAASDSATEPHSRVQLVFPQTNLAPGAKANAGLYFKLNPGWHVYWQNAGDAGEPPRIQWTLPDGVTASALEFPAPRRLPLGPLMDFGYENEVLFPFAIDVAKTAKPGPAVLRANVRWLICRDVCIPGKADLEEQVQIGSVPSAASLNAGAQALWNRFERELPTPLPAGDAAVFQSTATGFRLAVHTGQRETAAEFFPADQNIIDNPAPQKVTPTAGGLILDLKKDPTLVSAPAQLKGVLELSGGRNYRIAAVPGSVPGAVSAASAPGPSGNSAAGLAGIAGLAFLGGLLLNLMPCVFPVLSLKALALVRSGAEERHKMRAHGFLYAAGILVSFWILVAALLGLRAAGATLGWGFQFQSPVFLFLMAGVLFFLGLSLAGQFEIGLSLTGAGQSLAAKQGYAGSFFTGVLAVVVATPCTAPFMGTAIGYALAQTAAVTFAVFTALALGLAAPYVALSLQPAWTRLLPRPGAWMEIFRQAISVPIFATVIWLAWVLVTGYGAAPLVLLLASFLLLAVAGWFLGRWPARRGSTAAAVLLWLCVAGLAVFDQQLAGASVPRPAANASETAAGVWQPWSPTAVQSAVAAGRPVFVDFTASWCLSCQVNQHVALDKPQVLHAFAKHNVLLLKADWTREDPAITQALTALGRSGVPVYALYAPGQTAPTLLPQVLTPGIVVDVLAGLPSQGSEAVSGQ